MLAIENFGRFWRRDKSYWGRGRGNKGQLKGHLKRNKKVEVDFREQIGIYVLFDANRNPTTAPLPAISSPLIGEALRLSSTRSAPTEA
jgi:hypothetical protein